MNLYNITPQIGIPCVLFSPLNPCDFQLNDLFPAE